MSRRGSMLSLLSVTLLALGGCDGPPASNEDPGPVSPPVTDSPPPTPPPPLPTEITSGVPAANPDEQWNAALVQRAEKDQGLGLWKRRGVAVKGDVVQLERSREALDCPVDDIDGGEAHFDGASGLCAGSDPMATLPADVKYYAGAPFYFGTLVSPEVKTASPIDHLIPSWAAETPVGTWIQMHVRVKLASGWTGWYRLPIWSSDFSLVKRHSVKVASDATGGVDVDTFFLSNQLTASAYQLSVTLGSTSATMTPSLRMAGAVASLDRKVYPQAAADPMVWGQNLPIPQRSQGLPEYKNKGFGGGGEVWCSPTSTSMVMEYWSNVTGSADLNQTVPEVAAGTYDWVYDGTGNWPFNTAHASQMGLFGMVTRLYSMSEAERWIKAGVPVIISISFKAGELPGAPITKTNGHLIVVRGFDKNGDVIVNDPAARDNASVQLTYPRAALEAAWTHSHRTAYIIHPRDWGKTHALPAL